jgi:hypothetical protein
MIERWTSIAISRFGVRDELLPRTARAAEGCQGESCCSGWQAISRGARNIQALAKQTDLPISYNIAPSQKVLTIRFNPETDSARSLDALQRRSVSSWAKDPIKGF